MKPERIEKIRYWMGNKLPKGLFDIAVFFRVLYKNVKYREKKVSFGEMNPDKTFYVIRLAPPAAGFLANYNYVLGYMRYAFSQGWIPVIDMENYATLYQEDIAIDGTRNVWEYFFEQPWDEKTQKRYDLSEVYKSKNVVLGKADDQSMFSLSTDSDEIIWRNEMAKLVPFNEKTQQHISKYADEILKGRGSFIGMPIRGGDLKKRVIGHSKQPEVSEMFEILKGKNEEWKMDSVFISTEDESIIKAAQNEIRDVFWIERKRITSEQAGKTTNSVIFGQNNMKYQSLLSYLTEISILSKCDSLIGTRTNGTIVAAIWNGGLYKNVEIVDAGVWK